MLIKNHSTPLLISLFLSFALLSGCGSSNKKSPEKSWFYEHEFTQDATLHAKIENTVILDIASLNQPEGSESHAARYEYEESGEYVFCIDPNEKYITEMTLSDDSGNIEFTLNKEDGCINLYLNAGKYAMQITHEASSVPESGTVAFIYHPSSDATGSVESPPSDTNVTDDSNPPYYALQVTGGSYDGHYLAAREIDFTYYWSYDSPHDWPGQEDFLKVISPSKTAYFEAKQHLFAFESEYIGGVLKGYNWEPYFMPACWPTKVLWTENDDDFFCVDSQDLSNTEEMPTIVFMSKLEHFSGTDNKFHLLNTQVVLFLKQGDEDQTYTLWNEGGGFILSTSSLYAAENSLMYRTISSKGPVNPTLFTMNKNMPLYKDGSQYTLKAHEAALSGTCDLEGPTYVINSDISEIPKAALLALPQIKSIKLGGDYTTLSLFSEKDFANLNKTVGMDADCLKDPISFDTVGSLKVFNAKKVFLSSHQCNYCNLAGADLSDLSLNNVSLRYANLTNTQFNDTIMQKADMRYAKLYGANLNYTDLNGSTLCGAFLNGNSLSRNNAASLTGAYLKNVNLADSNLNGANFDYANFHSATSTGCIPTNCGYTTCASAANATLDSASFTNAYMIGTDFSNSTIMVSDFTNTVLTGAKFKNATIAGDPDKGASTKFIGAFIQGADFSDAKISSTDFTSAYVDISGNNAMFFQLSSAHSEFAGWTPSGEKVCTMYSYTPPTTVPSVDSTCKCPDGSSGPCTDWKWTHPATDMNKSTQKASYISDPNPVCDNPNFNW